MESDITIQNSFPKRLQIYKKKKTHKIIEQKNKMNEQKKIEKPHF